MTEIFRKGGQTLNRHKKTAIGGIGGIGMTTLITVVWPFIHSINQSIAKNKEEISALQTRVAVLEVKVQDVQDDVKTLSK